MEMEKCLFAQQLISNKKDNELEFHNLDNEFHRLLFDGVNKSNVWEAIRNISTHYNRMRLLEELNQDKKYIVEQHSKYLSIIKNKDKDLAEKITRDHIKEPADKWLNNSELILKYIKDNA